MKYNGINLDEVFLIQNTIYDFITQFLVCQFSGNLVIMA